MALKLYPTAGAMVTVYLASDEAMADANDAEALDAYTDSGDASALTVPDDATRVVLRVLSPSERASSVLEAGPAPAAFVKANAARESGEELNDSDLTHAEKAEMVRWQTAHNLDVCISAVESISDLPDSEAVNVGGFRRYPRASLLRFDTSAWADIAAHVARISDPPVPLSTASSPQSGRSAGQSGDAKIATSGHNSEPFAVSAGA